MAHCYPVHEAMRQFALGDIVEIREGSPFAYAFKGIQLKIVSLRIDPEGKQWASTIDFKPGYLPRHRGNGFYDSETTDIDAEHFSLIRPVAPAQGAVSCGVTDQDKIETLQKLVAEYKERAIEVVRAETAAPVCGEVERLRKGIQDYLDGNYLNPRQNRPKPCKHRHLWYQGCDECDEEYFTALLAGPSVSSTGSGGAAQ